MIAVTGGGTGGHLKIAKVVMDQLIKENLPFIYIGSTNGAETEWFKNYPSIFLPSSTVVDKRGINKVSSLYNIIKLSLKAKTILNNYNIKVVFSVGGYSAAPASIAAILKNTPLLIHEQNAKIGSLNKILKPFSKRFYNTFFYNDPYPIEEVFFKTRRIRKELKTIIFLGGSQGAKSINDLAMNSAKELIKKGIKIIHQTGKRDFNRVKNFYQSNNLAVEYFDFDINLHQKISQADLAISRAGASTLFELVANCLPTIFIPYPYASGDHQYFNAKWVEEKRGGIVKRTLTPSSLLALIESIDINKLSTNLSKIHLVNGVDFIVKDIKKFMNS